MGERSDLGYFGPDSVSWQVHREVTVLFGGARALLLQSAHPLVVAGARQTGMFQRNPWKRLQRTLLLQYTLTFGTKAEADAAAERINAIHEPIHEPQDTDTSYARSVACEEHCYSRYPACRC